MKFGGFLKLKMPHSRRIGTRPLKFVGRSKIWDIEIKDASFQKDWNEATEICRQIKDLGF